MHKKEVKNKNDQIYADYRLKKVSLMLQAILLLILILAFILSFFYPIFSPISDIIMSFIFLVIAYNNHTIYKRKYFTPIYILFSIIMLACGVFKFF